MIRHRPFGSEHPYSTTPDQRIPPQPAAGQSIHLGVTASQSVMAIDCEWDDGSNTSHLSLHQGLTSPELSTAPGVSTALSHLALAASALKSTRSLAWTVTAPALNDGARARYRFRATHADGTVITTRWFQVSASTWAEYGDAPHTEGVSRLVPGSVSRLRDADGHTHRLRFALALNSSEHVIGFGERYDRLDQRGLTLDAVVFEQYKNQDVAARTYLPMPFAHVLGGTGWAFHVDTTRRCWFDVGAREPTKLWIEVDVSADEADLPPLTVHFYDGSPADVLHQWLQVVGQPQALPPWVFGLWASGNEWNTQHRVLHEIQRHRDEDIPVGVVVVEAWSDESTFCIFRDATYPIHEDGRPHTLADFTYPADGAWPDPKGMVDALHAQDVRILLWQIPLMKMRPHPIGQARADADTMLQNGWGVKEHDQRPYRNRGWWFPQALMPDLTDPEARRWWLSKRRYLVDDIGIDGFKTDGGEHAWGHDLSYADGRRGDQANNLYPVHYAAAYGDLLTECGKAPVTFSRAGYTGSQAHGVFWAGDQDSTWATLRSCIVAGLSAAACGIVYWGWDLAGFSGDIPDAELYLRSTALACFMPIMQYHSEYNHHRSPSRDRTPWNIADRTGHPEVLPNFRRYAHLRSRLIPYLTTQAQTTIETGRPLMQSLCLAHPQNDEVWQHPYQYMLGTDLLIAPVTSADTTEQSVYLPHGDWTDVWSGTQTTGDRTITVSTPISHIPVWCTTASWPQLRDIFATTENPPLHPLKPWGSRSLQDPGHGTG